MLLERVLQAAPAGSVIPKPSSSVDFRVKGRGRRRGEEALVYYIPNHTDSSKPYEKGITAAELERAHRQLLVSGELTKIWFKRFLPACDKEGSCNFTTMGGLSVG